MNPSALASASNILKKRAPIVHDFAKRIFYGSRLPAIKFLNGKLTFVSPKLFSAQIDEPHILRWIGELLHPGDTFFDVGAHCGWMALAACHAVGRRGEVVAFEASPQLAETLQYNKAVNRFRQMEIVSKAVGDSDGQVVPFYLVWEGSSSLNSLFDHPLTSETGLAFEKSAISVKTITLDGFCRDRDLQPDVVKIDVEGAELLVLRGSENILKKRRTAFIVAIHPEWLPSGQSMQNVFDLFRPHGYELMKSNIVRDNGHGDYLFAPKRT